MDTRHPLVGKKLVKAMPGSGEVTREAINRTLGKVLFWEHWTRNFSAAEKNSWVVWYDERDLIVGVEKG